MSDEQKQAAGKAPACPTRKALEEFANEANWFDALDNEGGTDGGCLHVPGWRGPNQDNPEEYARAALSDPCPCAAELAELRAEHESAGKRWAKAFIENDSLRAKVEAVRSIADQARLSDRDLRGALEAIDAALREESR